ncbi:MAG: hypothetical protein NTW49_10750, partial [Bacteroidia bacterium]|nr:hypothetical protein [Bacteroidia bacterium]
QSWIATIVLVLNLVKLAGEVPLALIFKVFTFSANKLKIISRQIKILFTQLSGTKYKILTT